MNFLLHPFARPVAGKRVAAVRKSPRRAGFGRLRGIWKPAFSKGCGSRIRIWDDLCLKMKINYTKSLTL